LTTEELRFITDSLKIRQEYCERKESEMRIRQEEIRNLRRQVKQRGFGVEYKRLQELQKQRLHTWRQEYYRDGVVAGILLRRFEKLLRGEIQHSGRRTGYLLGSKKG